MLLLIVFNIMLWLQEPANVQTPHFWTEPEAPWLS